MPPRRQSGDPPGMAFPIRRHSPRHAVFVVAALMAVAALGSRPASAAAADLTVPEAEQEVVRLLNAERANAGLVALRVDPRLRAIARARSADMAAKGYFSHTQPDGRKVFDLLTARSIKWYAAGEVIAWNNWPSLADSASNARNGWMGSPSHRSIVLSGSYNYFGIGLAVDAATGNRLWTGVFIKGPDRTGGWVAFKTPSVPAIAIAAASTARYRTVTVSWRGGDVRLAVLTAGLRHYQVQVRTDGGSWRWFSRATTTPSRSIRLWRGHTYVFRARACDRVGNCGRWSNLGLAG
jgi:uncharacterized protein YkwD